MKKGNKGSRDVSGATVSRRYTPGGLKKGVAQRVVAQDIAEGLVASSVVLATTQESFPDGGMDGTLSRYNKISLVGLGKFAGDLKIEKAFCPHPLVPYSEAPVVILVDQVMVVWDEVCKKICGFKCTLPPNNPERLHRPDGCYSSATAQYCGNIGDGKAVLRSFSVASPHCYACGEEALKIRDA